MYLLLKTGVLQVNTYIVFEGHDAAVIDPGGSFDEIEKTLKKQELECKAVLLTHGHFDHIGAVKQLRDGGARVFIHADDAKMLENSKSSLGMFFDGGTHEATQADVLLHGGEELNIGAMRFIVHHTPGHTAGCVCYEYGRVIFSGDTLFHECYGRTDLPSGSQDDMDSSLKMLFALKGDYEVLPGHGDETTLEHEREFYPGRDE